MHDPKFEKEVQQKMTELEFSPSEAVWANVEKAINVRKTRRAVPFFWRLALPSLLLLAGMGYYFLRPARTTVSAPLSTSAAPASAPRASVTPVTATPATATPPTASATTATPASKIPTVAPETVAANVANETAARETTAAAGKKTRLVNTNRISLSTQHKTTQNNKTSGTVLPGTIAEKTTAKHSTTEHSATENSTTENTTAQNTATQNTANTPLPNQSRTQSYTPSLISLSRARSAIHAGKLAPQATTVKKLQAPRHPWEAAFVGGGGISSLHQTQLNNVALPANYAAAPSNSFATTGITQQAATPNKHYVSRVSAGPSFWAGIQAQKQLSSRWALSLGLALRYYSNRVHIGEQVTSYTPSANTLLTSSAVAPIQSYPYYSPGTNQVYTNKYYFLELPVALEYKINNSRLLPIFLDGGFSISYLMGSSAVYYNTHSGVYFKDGGVANHTQFNLSTALMVGLPIHGLRAQIGPQIQYGLTPLLNTGQSGEQHIFYGGIRLVVFPGKK